MASNTEETKATTKQSKLHTALFGKKFICVWCLPRDSKPAVRVEVESGYIQAGRLFDITCNSLGIYSKSREFFALFRGITFPTKKYEAEELIYLPCKSVVCIQKWCFDLTTEIKSIKTDAVAFRLLAMQFMFDIDFDRINLSNEDKTMLNEILDPEFLCYKEYVDFARTIEGYASYTFQNVQVVSKTKIVHTTFPKGCIVDVICSAKKLIIRTESMEVGVPWRKIRRFVDISETKSISLEIFLADERAFVWFELKSPQGTLLLQIITEYINRIKTDLGNPEFPEPKWVTEPKQHKLSWTMIKKELFGVKEKRLTTLYTFDTFDESYDGDQMMVSKGSNKTFSKGEQSLQYVTTEDIHEDEKEIFNQQLHEKTTTTNVDLMKDYPINEQIHDNANIPQEVIFEISNIEE